MAFDISIDQPIFPISQAAQLLGISVHTLRMYEREGLIIPFKRETKQRLYSRSDLDRIECIRRAINESKISINGIKTIYSLIPCWEIIKCTDEDRKNCQAFAGHEQPCWTYSHPNTICENKNCRECEVYKDHAECGKIKDLIKTITGKN